jgi:hypothetical protein
MNLQKVHLIVGLAGVLAFVLSGQYMYWALEVRFMEPGPRAFTRGTHIFLMYSSVLNVALGCFYSRSSRRWARVLQAVASWAILAGPLLLIASFLAEPYRPGLERPLSRYANELAFGGAFLFFIAHLAGRAQRSAVQEVDSPAV